MAGQKDERREIQPPAGGAVFSQTCVLTTRWAVPLSCAARHNLRDEKQVCFVEFTLRPERTTVFRLFSDLFVTSPSSDEGGRRARWSGQNSVCINQPSTGNSQVNVSVCATVGGGAPCMCSATVVPLGNICFLIHQLQRH